jgi:hypothetical protein
MSSSRKRSRPDEPASAIPAAYEGPEVLSALLARARSPNATEDVVVVFQRALRADEPRSAVIPTLFTSEPHFAGPDDARRLYANLFGLWDRLASGVGAHDDAPEVVPEPAGPPPLPERGSIPGEILPPDVVEAVWQHLAAAPPRDAQRRRDRFMNVQPDLAAWLDAAPLPDAGALAAQDLAFEFWCMFDQAFGERLGVVEFRELQALEREPPPLESVQPALAAYVAEQLDVLADEDESFGPPERAQVEKVAAAIGAALTAVVTEPS